MAKAKKVLDNVLGLAGMKDVDFQALVEESVRKAIRGIVEDELKRLGVTEETLGYAFTWLSNLGKEEAEKEKAAEVAGAAAEAEKASEPAAPPAEPGDVLGSPKLSWCYGGFNGSKAKVSEEAILKGATLKGDTLTIEWADGDCRNLGATSKTDAGHTVACLFLQDGAGGKFEWISSSRKTRSVKNVKDGYNKWPKTALDGGGRLWFCIAGVKDDKKTSNGKRTALVEVERK